MEHTRWVRQKCQRRQSDRFSAIEFACCQLQYSDPPENDAGGVKAPSLFAAGSAGIAPYRTAYYHEAWGFCLSHQTLQSLTDREDIDEEYEVYIDSSLEAGHLSYGEYYLPGATMTKILISCHSCHPSLVQ